MHSRIFSVGFLGVAAALFGVAAGTGCSNEETTSAPTTKADVQKASVALTLQDENGTRIGEGTGIVIAPRLVLTAAHLVAGKSRWTVKAADGTTVTGTRGVSYDWGVFNSNKSHPWKSDVAVIYLDKPIKLDVYPKIASSRLTDGAQATRVRGTGAGFDHIDATIGSFSGFPNAYVTDFTAGETLDTGGALLNANNDIAGVVMGKGLATGKLYIARTDRLANWISPKAVCAGNAMSVRTYETPGGGSSSGTTSSSSSGSTSGSNTTPNNPGGNGASGGNPNTNTCNGDGGGSCYGDCTPSGAPPGTGTGTGTGSSSGASSGAYPANPSNPSSSPSGNGGGGGGASSSGGGSGTNGVPIGVGLPGVILPGLNGGGVGAASSSGGGSGTNGVPINISFGGGAGGTATGSGTSNNNTVPASSGGGGSASTSGTGDGCSGPHDNSQECPPEPDGAPDPVMDYGGCACGGGGTNPDVH